MQQFAEDLLSGRGEASPVPLVQFAAVVRAGNAAQQRRKKRAGHHNLRATPPGQRTQVVDLVGERPAPAGMSLDASSGRSGEGEGRRHPGGAGVRTARAVSMQRLCGPPRRVGGKSGLGGAGVTRVGAERGSVVEEEEEDDDDDMSLFLPPASAAQASARANAVSTQQPLPKGGVAGGVGIMSHDGPDGSASSLSLVPTVFDVRAPTPPPSVAAGEADDRRGVLPSARRHAGVTCGGGRGMGMGMGSNDDNNDNNKPSGLRRSRGTVGRRATSSTRREFAGAVSAACGEVAGASVPASVLPGENARRPAAGDEAGMVEGGEWSSASEAEAEFWYGGCPRVPAPGDDWKSRWMRYEGDYR